MIQIKHNNALLAIIITPDFREEGAHFFTPNEFSQQLGFIKHPAGSKIKPHTHNFIPRQVVFTQEVLIIQKGKLRVDFYSKEKEYLQSTILNMGDIILLVSGGHGFEALEDIEMIEVKQGPHMGEADKTRFEGVSADKVKLKT